MSPSLPTSRLAVDSSRLTLPISRPAVLSLIFALSLLTYFFGLLLPYNLLTLGLKPLLNIAKLTRGDSMAQARFVITFAALSGLYYLAWRLCRGRQPRAMWIALIVGVFVINLSMLWLYPVGAADIFDNIIRGRITARYGGNPFYSTPKDYWNDPFLQYTAWRKSTSAYGPLWELIAAAASRIVGDNQLANVLGFKLVGLISYFGCVALIALILLRHAPERALQGACLFALNPLVIYETAGNGHNDIVMAFFIVLGIWALARNWFTLSAVAVTAGALVKFIPMLILPVVIVAGLRSRSGWKLRAQFLLVATIACAALVAITYVPFWKGGDPLAIKRREGLFTTSLPAMAQAQLEGSIGLDESRRVVREVALSLTALAVVAAMWRTWVETPPSSGRRFSDRERTREGVNWLAPIRASTFVLLFYLLFTCLWFQSWYTIWPLALAALLPEGETGRIAVLLSYAALWKTAIFDFFLYTGGPLPPRVWRETVLGPSTLGVIWLYGLYAASRKSLMVCRRWLTTSLISKQQSSFDNP